MGLSPDQLDTWILFSRSVLALEVGESLELADPFGLVRTCSVATADRRLRIVLNVSRSQRTRTARTVAALGGKPAVHHIAFAAADIFATVEALRARGAAFVAISGNYYDDLLARFALDAARVERMRRLGILYDRDGAGRIFPHLQRKLRRPLLLRDRATLGLRRVRRAQCPGAHGGARTGDGAQLSTGEPP